MDNEERQHLTNVLTQYLRRLRVLEHQAAPFGSHPPAEIVIEIEDLREKIADIKRQLDPVEEDPNSAFQRQLADKPGDSPPPTPPMPPPVSPVSQPDQKAASTITSAAQALLRWRLVAALVAIIILLLALNIAQRQPSPSAPNATSLALPGVSGGQLPPSSLVNEIIYRSGAQKVRCGIIDNIPGFSETITSTNGKTERQGLFIDLCRAVAIATFGIPNAVDIVPLEPANIFEAVRSGSVDVVFSNTPETFERDIGEAVDFGPKFFYDALGVSIRSDVRNRLLLDTKARTISIDRIKSEKICAVKYTNSKAILDKTTALTLTEPLSVANDLNDAFYNNARNCGVIAGSVSELSTKSKNDNLKDYKTFFLTEDITETKLLSREAWAPFFRENDSRWGEVINWAVTCPIAAEEFNITQKTIPVGQNNDPNINRLLGVEGFQVNITNPGLIPQSCRLIIAQLGNYGEIYDRHLKTLLPERGANKIYKDGGLLVPRLFR
jgi:general L-amino acid transport system substrate-binding protein